MRKSTIQIDTKPENFDLYMIDRPKIRELGIPNISKETKSLPILLSTDCM